MRTSLLKRQALKPRFCQQCRFFSYHLQRNPKVILKLNLRCPQLGFSYELRSLRSSFSTSRSFLEPNETNDVVEKLRKDLPSQDEERRSRASKKFSHVMDHLQSNIFIAGQRLNDLTGYSGIEALKKDIEGQGQCPGQFPNSKEYLILPPAHRATRPHHSFPSHSGPRGLLKRHNPTLYLPTRS